MLLGCGVCCSSVSLCNVVYFLVGIPYASCKCSGALGPSQDVALVGFIGGQHYLFGYLADWSVYELDWCSICYMLGEEHLLDVCFFPGESAKDAYGICY